MSEIENQLSVFRAADAALEERPFNTDSVALLLAPYEYPETVGWFGRLMAWIDETQPEADPLPTVDEALGAMAEGAPEGRLRSRRLLALAVLTRADDRYGAEDDGRGRVAAA